MTRLDPIFALPPEPARYLDSVEFLNVQIAEREEQIEQLTVDADRKRREIPILEREVAEHERDVALAKLKILDLRTALARRQAACE